MKNRGCDVWEPYRRSGFSFVWSLSHDGETHLFDSLVVGPRPRRLTVYVEHRLACSADVERAEAAQRLCELQGIVLQPEPPTTLF